ncbi:NCS2 family permease, partial [Escherichia coli]|nr:NCS2 family permease [Escherichia coli]
IVMGVLGRYPISLAPGMGLNAFFAYTVVLTMGIPWQTALTGVMISGVIFILLTLTSLREKIINSIPIELKMAVGAGIGLFISFIGMKGAGIIVKDDATFVGLGDLTNPTTLLAVFGIVITIVLMVLRVNAAVFIG